MLNEWEIDFIQFLQSMGTGPAPFMSFITDLITPLPVIITFLFVYCCVDQKLALRMFICLNIARFLTGSLKNIFRTPRPIYNERVKMLYSNQIYNTEAELDLIGYGTPSRHALVGTAFYGFPAWEVKNIWIKIVCIVLPLTIGFTRIYLGFQTPLHILAGHLTGIAVIILVVKLEKIIIGFIKKQKPLVIIGILMGSSAGLTIFLVGDLFIFSGMNTSVRFIRIAESLRGLSLLTGILLGMYLFSLKGVLFMQDKWWKRLCRFFISLIVVIPILDLPLLIVNTIDSFASKVIFLYITKVFAGVLISYVLPLFFIKLKLAEYQET